MAMKAGSLGAHTLYIGSDEEAGAGGGIEEWSTYS